MIKNHLIDWITYLQTGAANILLKNAVFRNHYMCMLIPASWLILVSSIWHEVTCYRKTVCIAAFTKLKMMEVFD